MLTSNTSRDLILSKIKAALASPSANEPSPLPADAQADLYTSNKEPLLQEFTDKLQTLMGNCIVCSDLQVAMEKMEQLIAQKNLNKVYCRDEKIRTLLKSNKFNHTFYNDLPSCDVSITDCEALVARTATIVMTSAQQSGRTTSVYAPIHFCIAYKHQLVYDIHDALTLIEQKYKTHTPSLITFATGPSRTADIEKTLVVGIHGPKEVYCFVVGE
jgi:L-lactate dehydrogenase complex protein LldG